MISRTFCPLIMGAGRPQKVDPGTLYAFAHQFYWDLRRLSEGRSRQLLDRTKREQLDRKVEKAQFQLSHGRKARLEQMAEEEIRNGRLNPTEKDKWLRDAEEGERSARRLSLQQLLAERFTKRLKVRAEPDVLEALLDPEISPERVREICKDAFMTRTFEIEPGVTKEVEVPAWPISAGSTLPTYLSQYAEQYVEAFRDLRFPRCDVSTRPTNRLKQFWFLSRALAGALFGVTTRTAINLVGSMRPEQVFRESRDGKPARKQRKRRHKS